MSRRKAVFSYTLPGGALNTRTAYHSNRPKKGGSMAGIFTRKSIAQIMTDENLTPEERTDQIFATFQINSSFAAHGRIHSRQQGSGNLNVADAPQVGGRSKAG